MRAKFIEDLPAGKHSTFGVGEKTPDSSNSVKLYEKKQKLNCLINLHFLLLFAIKEMMVLKCRAANLFILDSRKAAARARPI